MVGGAEAFGGEGAVGAGDFHGLAFQEEADLSDAGDGRGGQDELGDGEDLLRSDDLDEGAASARS